MDRENTENGSVSLSSMPADLLSSINRFLSAVDTINLKFVCRNIRVTMERGGLTSFRIVKYESAPFSPTWLLPVINSRLTELIVSCRERPNLPAGIMASLPSSLRRIRLSFEGSMAFLEPLPSIPGVTTSLQESFRMMNMGSYFPNLRELRLTDTALSWKLKENEQPFVPTASELESFIADLPRTLSDLKLHPYPTRGDFISNLPNLTSFKFQWLPHIRNFDLPPTLTNLTVDSSAFAPTLDYDALPNLVHLALNISIPHTPMLPSKIKSLKLGVNAFLSPSNPLPNGLHTLRIGSQVIVRDWVTQMPQTLTSLRIDSVLKADHLRQLPQNLKILHFGSAFSARLGLGDEDMKDIPPEITSLTIEGHTPLTHNVWANLPKKIKFLNLPALVASSAFLKLMPASISELRINILEFTFKEGIALMEDDPSHMTLPNTLAEALLSKLVPSGVIFVKNRASCDINDASAAMLPRSLRSLTVLGSHVGITDEFARRLPPSLRVLRMPNQLTFTSRVVSLIPRSVHSLELDGYGLPEDIALPATIAKIRFNNPKFRHGKNLNARKPPR